MHTVIVFALAICGVCHTLKYARSGPGRVIHWNPCSYGRTGKSGVCMYTWDCLKLKGIHVAFCRDSFYIGSCCKLPDEINLSYGALPDARTPPVSAWDVPFRQAATTYDWIADPYRDDPPASRPTKPELNFPAHSESATSPAIPMVYPSVPSAVQELPPAATELHGDPGALITSDVLQQIPLKSSQQEFVEAASSKVPEESATRIVSNGADRRDRSETADEALPRSISSPSDPGATSRTNSSQCLIGTPGAPSNALAGANRLAETSTQGISIIEKSGSAASETEHPISAPSTLSKSETIPGADEDLEAPNLIASQTTSTPMEQSNTTQAAAAVVEASATADETTDVTPGTTGTATEYDSVNAICGRPKMFFTPRVVGGGPTRFGEWPWMISLQRFFMNSWWHFSGATLLNQHWAVSAAHCFNYVPLDEVRLVFGENDLMRHISKPQRDGVRLVERLVTHPAFNALTYENDVALIRFREPVTFSENVIPVCITNDNKTFAGERAVVTGWGRLFENGPVPSVLQRVQIPILTNQECERMFFEAGLVERLPQIFICAGLSSGGMDSCEGDSGGPMVIQDHSTGRWDLIGINSWGIGCGAPNQPGVYTRITEFSDWIRQITV